MTRYHDLSRRCSCAAALAACAKNAVQDITGARPGAQRQVLQLRRERARRELLRQRHEGDGDQLDHSASESTTGTALRRVGNGGFYAGARRPASTRSSGRIAAATDKELAIATLPPPLADGKYYSFYLSGIYNATAKTVGCVHRRGRASPQTLDLHVAYVRFVNAISNSSPMTLYAKNTTTGTESPIGASVAYKGAGALTPVPIGPLRPDRARTPARPRTPSPWRQSFSAGRVLHHERPRRHDDHVDHRRDPAHPDDFARPLRAAQQGPAGKGPRHPPGSFAFLASPSGCGAGLTQTTVPA